MEHTWFVEQTVPTEAVDDAAADNAIEAEPEDGIWQPMPVADQRRLESAFLASQGKLVTINVHGRIGLSIQPSGRVAEVSDGIAKRQGVREGWQVCLINDQAFSDELMMENVLSGEPFNLTFFPFTLCNARKPVEGDKVRSKDAKEVAALVKLKDKDGIDGAWELKPGEYATVIEVDEDGDFRLRNDSGVESVFTYSKDYCYLQDPESDNQGSADVIPVQGGRAEVRLEERTLADRYACIPPPPPQRICRVLWVREIVDDESGKATLQPYSEDADMVIEAAYQDLFSSAESSLTMECENKEFKREVELPPSCKIDGDRGVLRLELVLEYDKETEPWTPKWDLKAREVHTTHLEPNWFGKARQKEKTVVVKRGYGESPEAAGEDEEEQMSSTISHLVIVLHSNTYERQTADQATSSTTLRTNLHRWQMRMAKMANSTEDGTVKEFLPPPKAEVLEVSWDQGTRAGQLDSALHHRLDQIKLPSILPARQLVNHAAVSALLYARHREEIMSAVVDSIEAAVLRFGASHPNFKGVVVVVGHSLGGAALFDILTEQSLSFQPWAFYALGSPIGLLLETEDAAAVSHSPGGTRFFNIFHPIDPIAYRVEPLLVPELAELGQQEPQKIPSENNEGGDNWASLAKKKVEEKWNQGVMKATSKVQEVNVKADKTLDWVLDEFENRKWLDKIPDQEDVAWQAQEVPEFTLDNFLTGDNSTAVGSSASSQPSTPSQGIPAGAIAPVPPRQFGSGDSRASPGSSVCASPPPELSTTSRTTPPEIVVPVAALQYNVPGMPQLQLHGRVDWVLQSQQDSRRSASGRPLSDDVASRALASHLSYLQSVDVAQFIYASSQSLFDGSRNDVLPKLGPIGQFGKTMARTGQQFGVGVSQKWRTTGAQAGMFKAVDATKNAAQSLATGAGDAFQSSGAADIVKGTQAAAVGIIGTARAIYGTAKLVGTGVGAVSRSVGGVATLVERQRSPGR